MDNYPGLVNVEANLPAPGIEWEIRVNRKQASKFGANISSIGNVIKLSTNGIKLGEYRPDDTSESIPIYLRYPQEGRTLDMLAKFKGQYSKWISSYFKFCRNSSKKQNRKYNSCRFKKCY